MNPSPPSPRRRRARVASLAVAALLAWGWVAPSSSQATTSWSRNLFTPGAMVFQDPYPNACIAASTMTMLNTIAYRHTGGPGFRWTRSTVKNSPNPDNVRDVTSILAFARAHDTLSVRGIGSDSHGWRNAINYYGWGQAAMQDPAKRIYESLAYSTYDRAVHAAVRAIARFGMPVGIAAMAGGHAEVLTGYVVDGANPATSDAFAVRYVYLTDPLKLQGHVNYRVSNATLKGGTFALRFAPYRETDSPQDDPYAAGWKRSSVPSSVGPSEWYRRWVIVAPIRSPVPPTPPPTPTPTPAPSTGPTPTPPATPPPQPTSSPSRSPSPVDDPTPTPAATDAAPPSVPPSGAPEPSLAPPPA